MIVKFKGRVYKVGHMDIFIKKYESESAFNREYYKHIYNKEISFRKYKFPDNCYFLVYRNKELIKHRFSIFYNTFIPVQSVIMQKLSDCKPDKYICETSFGNYYFEKDNNFYIGGIKSDNNMFTTFKLNEDEIKNYIYDYFKRDGEENVLHRFLGKKIT